MQDYWSGVSTQQIQEVLVALLGGALAGIVTWVLVCDD